MVHAAGIDPTHTSRARALVSDQFTRVFKQTLAALPALIGMAVHLNVLYVRKVCLVKIEIHRVRIMTQRSTDVFCDLLSVVVIIRLDEFINAHVRLESGLYTIEVFECDSGKFFQGYIVILFVRLVKFRNCRFQIIVVPLAMDGFSFQIDDGFVLLDVCRQGIHVDTSNWVVYDFINKKVTLVTNSQTHCESGL